MSRIIVDSLRGNSASSDAISLANDGTCTANITNNLSNRNLLINSEFNVWQRGTSWSSGVNRYVMDRWYQWGNNGIPSQITGTNGSQYGVRLQHNDAGTNTFSAFSSTLEKKDIVHTIGKHLTLSFWMRKGSAFTGNMSCQIVARTDSEAKINSGTNVTIANTDVASSLTTSWQKFTINTTQVVPTTEVIGVNFWHSNTSGTDANNYFEVSQVQLEVGSVATDFEHRSYGQELALCQRYYETHNSLTTAKTTDGSVTSQWSTITSNDSNTLVVSTGIIYKVPKRASPTVTLYNSSDTTTAARVNAQGTERTVTASYGGPNALTRIYVSGASAGNYVTYNWEASAEL